MSIDANFSKIENAESYWREVEEPVTTWIPDPDYPPDEHGGQRLKEVPTGEMRIIEKLDPVLDTLIVLTAGIGIGDLNEKTFKEFWTRLNYMQKVDGPFLVGTNRETGETKGIMYTEEMIAPFMGLHTNVSYVTRSEWINRRFWFKEQHPYSDKFIRYEAKYLSQEEDENADF